MKIISVMIVMIMMIVGMAVAGDSLWYGNTNAVTMTNAMNYLNSSSFLPAPGWKNGVEIPNQTTSWCNKVDQTTNLLWYCIPKIPEKRLDAIGVPETNRVAFMEAFNITILTNPVIIVEEDIEDTE
jgi:hypothetical protein